MKIKNISALNLFILCFHLFLIVLVLSVKATFEFVELILAFYIFLVALMIVWKLFIE